MNCRFCRILLATAFAASPFFCASAAPCAAEQTAAATPPPLAYVGAAEPATRAEIYGQGVRETEWQTPAAEKAGFHLPPGFEVELFADEQLINKPLNMAWDTRGRLWVTSTLEYPYPAKPGTVPRDSIRILEDTDGDFRADKVTVFADELNIPMGLLPVKDGVICFSIPHIWYLKDVDGDDKVDERIQLLGPFDTTRDTHGMVSSLTRGADGWIYACHGFNNQSSVTAKDGSKVQLNSGNTFRFREDGSSIQQYTQGQVNPFGLTRDQWGNWYSADCHSKPLTALLPGACYPSFGRPHDGLGFAPDMMEHLHGSTAICGLTYYQASHFPLEYRHLFYSGNVMTSRINCNAPQWNGATIAAIEQPDFMTSDDPWFRPVDIQLGPDGAVYVADFYNKIIGHYEVPLEHPERDRDSGRIWRIVYRGDREHTPAVSLAAATDFAQSGAMPNDVLTALDDDNLTRRRLALETALTSQVMPRAELERIVLNDDQPQRLRMSALEWLHRSGELQSEVLFQLVASGATNSVKDREQTSAPELMVLALRLAEWTASGTNTQVLMTIARAQLQQDGKHPQVVKAAVELLGRRGSADDVSLLLRTANNASSADPALLHASRIAVRELLRDDDKLRAACGNWLSDSADNSHELPHARLLAHILPGVDSPLAAKAMLGYVARHGESDQQLVEQAINAASRYATPDLIERLLQTLSSFDGGNAVAKATRFHQLCDSYRAKQGALSAELVQFGVTLQAELLSELARRLADSGTRVTWMDAAGKDWAFQPRGCADGEETQLISSHALGEKYTGVLSSEAIVSPKHLSFWLAGHDGVPDNPPQRLNLVRLVNTATGEVIHTAYPPRNDQAQLVQWDLSSCAGELVRVEVVDGDGGDAYAWLAVGRFSDLQLERGNINEIIAAVATSLRQGFKSADAVGAIQSLPLSPRQRAGLVVAALQGAGSQPAATLAQQALQLNRVDLLTGELLGSDLLGSESDDRFLNLSIELCASATAAQQTGLAKALLSTPSGCVLLNKLLDRGVISLFALQNIDALLPSGLNAELKSQLEEHLAAAAELPSTTVDVGARLASLTANAAWTAATAEAGQQLYTQHCAVCHQLRGTGNLVGPQLDGAVVRGRDRLAEDILDPNRNVDRAFRLSALLMEDDSVVTGLVQASEDGRTVIVTSQDGKKAEYRADAIAERRDSTQSLMPSNFGEVLSDEQLAALLTYLSN